VEIRNDGIDIELFEPQDHQTEEPQDDQTKEPQDVVFHQPMKLSELVQKYLKHQPAKFVATIHQQQQTIEELRHQKESSFNQQQQIIKELENQNELLMNSHHKQQVINVILKKKKSLILCHSHIALLYR